MAQIRKFSGGGSPEASTTQNSPKKPYKLTIDGKTFDLDDDDIYRWSQSQSPNLTSVGGQAFQDVINAIKRGVNVHYNSATNTFSGVNFSNKDIVDQLNANRTNPNQKQAQRQLKNWAKRAYRKGDIRQDWMVDTANFMKYNFAQPVQQNQETTETPKTSLFGSYGNFQYETDDQGNTSWSQSPLNASALQLLKHYSELGTLSREDAFNRYNMDETKYNQFMDWYNTYGQDYKWNDLITRIQNKQFDPYDNELLELLGWNINSNQETTPKITAHQYEGAGFDEDYLKQNNLYVRQGKDENGNTHTYLLKASTDANGNVTYNPVTDIYNLMNMDWASNSQFANGSIVGGRFYNQDETWNQNTPASKAMQIFRNVANLTNEDGTPLSPEQYRQALRETGIIFAGMDQPSPFLNYYDPSKSVLTGFEHITSPIYYADLTHQFNVPQGRQIISYVNPTERDPKTGLYTTYYTLNNDPEHIFNTQEALQNYLSTLSITPATGVLDTSSTIEQYDKLNYNGKEYLRANKDAKVQEGDQIKNINIYKGKDGRYYYFGANNELYEIVDANVLNKIINGNVFSSDEWLKESKRFNWFRRTFGNPRSGATPYQNNQYNSFLGFKQGGKIPILQYGGLLTNAVTNVKTRNSSEDRVGKLHTVGNGPSTQDASDKWANAATALDVGSGALALTGFGNVAAGLAGLGGTAARFVSDIKRDGLDGGDLTRLGLNLGLDILTLIPFAGGAAKAVKIAKAGKEAAKLGKNASKLAETTKKTEELISKADVLGDLKIPRFLREPGNTVKKLGRAAEIALPAVGTAQAAGATINAIKDGEITSDEMATIANGLVSGALLKRGISRKLDRAALKAAQKKVGVKQQEQPFIYKAKKADGTPVEIKVEAKDLIGKRKKEIQTLLEKRFKDANADFEKSGIKAEDLIDKFNIPFKDGPVSWVNKNWNKSGVSKPKKLDVFDEKALANDELYKALTGNNLGYWDKRAARAYQYGLIRNSGAHEYITNRFGRSVVPTGSMFATNPFSNNNLKWDVHMFQSDLLPTVGPRFPATLRAPLLNGIKHRPSRPIKNITPERHITAQVLNDLRKAKPGVAHAAIKRYGTAPYHADYEVAVSVRPEIRNMMHKILSQNKNEVWSFRNDLAENFLFKQGGKIIKAQNGTGSIYYNNSNENRLRQQLEASGVVFGENGQVDWEKTYDPNGKYMQLQNYYIQNWDQDWFAPVRQAHSLGVEQNLLPGKTMEPLATITDENGVKTSNKWKDSSGQEHYYIALPTFDTQTTNGLLGPNHVLMNDALTEVLKTHPLQTTSTQEEPIDGGTLNEATVTANQTTPTSTVDMSKYANPQIIEEIIEEDIPKYKPQEDGLRQTTWYPKWLNLNLDDVIGGMELARSLGMNTAMFNSFKRANKLIQKEMPTEIYDRYQDHITPMFNEQARRTRQFFVPTSTDALTNYAMRQTNEDRARDLEIQGYLEASKNYSQWLQNDLAARRAYAEDRRNTAFFNRQEMANKLMRDAQIDMQRKLANNQSIQNAVLEFRNKLAQDRQRYMDVMNQKAVAAAQNKFTQALQNAGSNYYNKFLSDSELRQQYADWTDYWQSQDLAGYQTAYNKAQEDLQTTMQAINGAWLLYHPKPKAKIDWFKSGGKTSTYQQRHNGPKPDEAIWIQRNKDTAKAIEKLHDAVIKLFMKSIS